MASDEDYMAFLDKANQDPNEGYTKPQSSKQEFKTTDDGAKIPAAIEEATKDAFYVSDADEPFVPVSLAWDEGGKGLPDEGVLRYSIQLYCYYDVSVSLSLSTPCLVCCCLLLFVPTSTHMHVCTCRV
jgi:hypothetical protein